MEQHLSITISKPCSEKFNQFKQTATGGFCNSCQKEVIDFRNMSDEKLIEYFKNREGNTCGYFKTSQLKDYSYSPELKKTTNLKYLRIVGLAFLSMIPLQNIQAQNGRPKIEVVEQSQETKKDQVKNDGIQEDLLTGVISDESGPIPGVNVLLKGTHIGVATNFDGEFIFPKELKEGDVLVVSFIGYETQNIVIKKDQSPLNIIMKGGSCVLLGEVAVNNVYKSKTTLWQKIKRIF